MLDTLRSDVPDVTLAHATNSVVLCNELRYST